MEQTEEFIECLVRGATQVDVELSGVQIDRFSAYYRELRIWNKKINLTAITGTREIAIKHFVDSLAAANVMTDVTGDDALLDVGAGAGFPGLPLKILFPQIQTALLEPNQKKTAFLRHVIGTLNLKGVKVVSQALEPFSRDATSSGRFNYVTTRALEMQSALDNIRTVLSTQGHLILWRSTPLTQDMRLRDSGFRAGEDYVYELPYGLGKRVLTMLTAVPRGTALAM